VIRSGMVEERIANSVGERGHLEGHLTKRLPVDLQGCPGGRC